MPSPVLHLTHAQMLAHDDALPAALRAACRRELPLFRLGSIFPDLPFYTNIVPMTLGYWLELPAEYCVLARRMHSDQPDRFTWHLIRQAAQAGPTPGFDRTQRLALVAGHCAHVALDLELHGLVNWCARRDTMRHGGHESHHHRLAEKYHSLFFHLETFGRDCLGSLRFFRQNARVLDGASLLALRDESPVVRWIAATLGYYREQMPGPRQVASWIRTFRHFALLVSTPFAARNSRRLRHAGNRERYYENADFRFTEFWDRGYARSLSLIALAHEAFESLEQSTGDPQVEAALCARFLEAAQIGDLAYPSEAHLPLLERRPAAPVSSPSRPVAATRAVGSSALLQDPA